MDYDNIPHDDQFLLEERFKLLVDNLPKLYFTVITIVCFVVFLLGDAASCRVLAVWAAVLIVMSLVRGHHWWRLKKYGYHFDADEIRRRLEQTDRLGLALLAFFASVGYLVTLSPDMLLRATTMLALWAAAVGTAFYLFVLPRTAGNIVTGATAVLCAVFLWSGDRTLLMATPMFIAVSVALLHFLRRNFETFTTAVEARAIVDVLRKEALRLANTDALTDLPNRRAFEERLAALVAHGKPFALAILDLDGFKPVNDTYGHGVGDKTLVVVARRVRDLGVRAFTARLGGDEFALLVEDAEGAETVLRDALDMLSAAYLIDDLTIHLGASCGLAYWRNPGDEARLLEQADAALYRAKQRPDRRSDGPDRRSGSPRDQGSIALFKAAA